MADLSYYYGNVMNDARQNLVRMPDGSYAPFPQFGQPTSVADMYAGMIPPSSTVGQAPTTRSVQTMPVTAPEAENKSVSWRTAQGRVFDPSWWEPQPAKQVAFTAPTSSETRAERKMLPYPADFVPTPSIAAMNSRDIIENRPPAVAAQNKPSTIDATNALDASRMGFTVDFSKPANPALNAIDQLTGSGRSTATPFPLPYFRQPTVSPPVEITVNGGMPQKAGPVPLRGRPLTPYMHSPSYIQTPGSPYAAAPGAITFQRGDTVSELAKQRGMTTGAFASLYGITNPDKIKAGQTVVPRVPAPRVSVPTARAPSARVQTVQPRQQSRAERFSNLDEFGNIL